jgi:hypothetical protein
MPAAGRTRNPYGIGDAPLVELTEEEIAGCPYRNCGSEVLNDTSWCADRRKWLQARGRWKPFYSKRHELHAQYKAARRRAFRRDANNDALEWALRLKPGESSVVVVTGKMKPNEPAWLREQAEKDRQKVVEAKVSRPVRNEERDTADDAEHETKVPTLDGLPAKTAEDMDWVACHADDDRIPYEAAPSKAAVQVLRWVRSDAKSKDTFFTHYMKTAQKKADEAGVEEKDEGHERALKAIEDLRDMSDEALEEAAAFREESGDSRPG